MCNKPVYCEVVPEPSRTPPSVVFELSRTTFPSSSSAPSAVLFLFGGTLPLETLPLRGQMAEEKVEKEGEVAQETLMSPEIWVGSKFPS